MRTQKIICPIIQEGSQSKSNAQAAEITTMKTELNKALDENKKLKSLFSLEKMVQAMSKVVSAMTVQGCPKTSKGTQYEGASNYVGRLRQPQLACGADGTLQLDITCFYYKETRHVKNNCAWLNSKIVQELAKEQVTEKRPLINQVLVLRYQKNNGSSDLGPV